jgi:DnaJ-class molecular chaperone
MADRLDQLDYYTLLGVGPEASQLELKRAFRNFARRYHPDRFAGKPDDKIERATQIYRRGSEAYRVLSDPVARRSYDAAMSAGRLRLSADDLERAVAEAEGRTTIENKPTIRSPQARAFYDKAARASKGGDLRGAWKLLRTALEHEPGNPIVKKAIGKVEARIRRMG